MKKHRKRSFLLSLASVLFTRFPFLLALLFIISIPHSSYIYIIISISVLPLVTLVLNSRPSENFILIKPGTGAETLGRFLIGFTFVFLLPFLVSILLDYFTSFMTYLQYDFFMGIWEQEDTVLLIEMLVFFYLVITFHLQKSLQNVYVRIGSESIEIKGSSFFPLKTRIPLNSKLQLKLIEYTDTEEFEQRLEVNLKYKKDKSSKVKKVTIASNKDLDNNELIRKYEELCTLFKSNNICFSCSTYAEKDKAGTKLKPKTV